MLIFLVGYAGSGKSSLGRRLARHLGVRFVDTDTEVERRVGASIADIFLYEGEEYFRREEHAALETVAAEYADAVIATGGGLPTWSDNMSWMKCRGLTVYLRRSARNIMSRMSSFGRERRPLFRGKSDAELLEFMQQQMTVREPYYAAAAITVECDTMSDDALVKLIVGGIEEM